MGLRCHQRLMMPMHTKGVCVCVKRFCGPVYVLVDLSYISQQCVPGKTIVIYASTCVCNK